MTYPRPPTWRRRFAIIGAIAVAHFVASSGAILLARATPMSAVRLPATLAYTLLWPFAFLVGNAVQEAGLTQLAGHRIALALSLVANSLLWAIALYALWTLATRLHRRSG